jgi:Putative sugar-binding domain
MASKKKTSTLTTQHQHICSAYAAWLLTKNKNLDAIMKSLKSKTKEQAFDSALSHWATITKSTLSKCKDEARGYRLFKEVFDMNRMIHEFPDLKLLVDRVLTEDVGFKNALMNIGGGVLKEVRVMPAASKFDEFCALQILMLMREASTIGVMWGRMVKVALDALTETQLFLNLPDRLRCLPVSGEPTFMLNVQTQFISSPAEYSATVLAMKLAETISKLAGNPGKPQFLMPSLLGVPCYVGMEDLANLNNRKWQEAEAERDIALKKTHRYPGWQTIFGEGGLAGEIDMLITGIGHVSGAVGSQFGMFIQERAAQEGLSPSYLQSICHGDLAGTLLIKKGLNKRDQQIAEALNQGWTGLKQSDLKRISLKSPGVVLICEGNNKADAVEQAIRSKLVTTLICDRPLRDALMKRLPSSASTTPPSTKKRHS